MRPIIYPYKLSSLSAIYLSKALQTFRVREKSKYNPKEGDLIINWGNPRIPDWYGYKKEQYLNRVESVQIAQCKLTTLDFFKAFKVSSIEWTTEISQARRWSQQGAVIQRNLLRSHSGRGIVNIGYDEETSTPDRVLSHAPLYTKYKKKAKEFRVHVMKGQVIDVQEKKKIKDFEGEFNPYIRNHSNGWVFARENIEEPKDLRQLAIKAVVCLGLDFRAVDIIYNEHENICYCLEVNTAPGLEGTTLINYINAIQKLL